jgi:hypothetical protein
MEFVQIAADAEAGLAVFEATSPVKLADVATAIKGIRGKIEHVDWTRGGRLVVRAEVKA